MIEVRSHNFSAGSSVSPAHWHAMLTATFLPSPRCLRTLQGYRSRTVGFIAKRAPSNDPYLLATSAYPPTYLVHGDADPVVPRACSDRFHARLQALGVDSTLAIVPGAGHGWAIEEGGEGELGERFEMDKKAFEWLVRRIKASA